MEGVYHSEVRALPDDAFVSWWADQGAGGGKLGHTEFRI